MARILEPFVTAPQVLIVPSPGSTFGYMQQSAKNEFASRLNEVLDTLGIAPKFDGRQVAVAKMFGVSQKGARKWLEGEGLPKFETCIEIAKKLGVHTEWLISGRGEKWLDDRSAPSAIDELPTPHRQEALDFLEFKGTKVLQGERLARYLRWVDRMKENPPPAHPPRKAE